MAHETRVPSNLPDPPCGFYLWKATQDDPGVRVVVTFEFGIQVAEILEGEDVGEVVPFDGMKGIFVKETGAGQTS